MPTAKEFTIRLEDRPGTLGKVSRALADRGVNILAFQSLSTARRSRNQTCTYHIPASIVTEGNISARLATNLRISVQRARP